jgi:hypothetical protein
MVEVKQLPARPARGVRIQRTTKGERDATRAIIAAHAGRGAGVGSGAAALPEPGAGARVHPAPRGASAAGGKVNINSQVNMVLKQAGFRVVERGPVSCLYRHEEDGREVEARTQGWWRHGEVEGKGAKALARLLGLSQ